MRRGQFDAFRILAYFFGSKKRKKEIKSDKRMNIFSANKRKILFIFRIRRMLRSKAAAEAAAADRETAADRHRHRHSH